MAVADKCNYIHGCGSLTWRTKCELINASVNRISALYDLVCTIYYPEIENRLAMKIGGQDNADLVYPKEIDAFAKEASLGAAQARRNLVALAELVRANVHEIDQPDETAQQIAGLIAGRCDGVLSRFSVST